ncbi:MAG: Carbon-nitrogen hydrolase [Alectoria sarmentosa]|nr:MAG: Carbon-nitrogen hydrolase [Alectoria sarmentosa]
MRIACLQFDPELGRLPENIARANVLLEAASPQNLDLLVLPELAFTGYNYPSLSSILPHLEPTAAGPSTAWARATASRLNCIVTVGYPELCIPPPNSTTDSQDLSPAREVTAYNSTISVSPSGEIVAHYRKTHLYYTDETWAQESPSGWLSTSLTFAPKTCPERTVKANYGICMDLNPHKFKAPWEAYEFASHALASESDLLVLSMAWLTELDALELAAHAKQPDLHTLSYWVGRLKPLVEADQEVVAVFANRCGQEPGKNPLGIEEGVRYAGSSWIGKVRNRVVMIWDIMGRAEEGVVVVDTDREPKWTLQLQQRDNDKSGE